MSLDLLMGYTGLVSFGHAAFYGLGAYATAILLERGVLSVWACLGAALVVVGFYAAIVSYFATARRGIYFALLTLIFAEVVYTFFRYTQTFGGSDGIQGLPDALLWRGVAIDTPRRKYYLVLVYLAAAYAICRVVVTSHFGRVLVAIRENEDRARFLGYNVQRYKMAACMIAALRRVGFAVSEGQVFSVIGPNGAGKSTLFNVVSGLYAPSAGRVTFRGHEIAGWPPERINRLGIAKTFQITNIFPAISVRENVRVAAQSRAPESGRLASLLRSADVEARGTELLEPFGLATRRDEPAQNLSHGEQRYLEICLALATEPTLLLLD